MILATILMSAGVLSAQPSFNKIDSGPIADVMKTSFGAAWGDFNNDNYEDLFLCNGSEGNQLFVNNGDGTFTEVMGSFSTPTAATYSASWGDYDNDGYNDLFIASTKQNILLKNNGDGTLTSVSAPMTEQILFSYRNTRSVSWCDINLDGKLDALEVNIIDNPYYFINTGATFNSQMINKKGEFYNGIWSDVDHDRYPELLLNHYRNTNIYFDNDEGALVAAPAGDLDLESADFYSGSWADYDNDGDMDLFVTVSGSDKVNMLFQNVNGVLTKVTVGDIATDVGDSRGCAWGDYNNDGWIDLYVSNSGSENFLYENNGDGTFTKITGSEMALSDGHSSSCSWVDLNRDGQLDLYVTDLNATLKNTLFINEGTGANWFAARLRGTVSNASAIGAKVKVKATIGGETFWQMREITGQTAYATQNGLFVHFGLGDAAMIDTLKIEWPSGIVQVYTGENVNQFKEITEIEPPAAPAVLTATAKGHDKIELTWSDDSNEDLFIIEQSEGDNSNFVVAAETGADVTTFEIGSLKPNTTYFFRVKAKNVSGESDYSPEANATTDPVLIAAPSGLIATALSPFEIQLSWEDNSDNEAGFAIERSSESGTGFVEIKTVAENVVSFNDEGLTPGTAYFYRVKAIQDEVSSSYSNEASVSTLELIIAAPSDFTAAIVAPDRIELTWTDNSDNETGFRIVKKVNGGEFIYDLAADSESYVDTEVSEETEYEYTLKAMVGAYESESIVLTVATPPFIVRPDQLVATAVSYMQIDLSWRDNSDNETGFVIERAEAIDGPYAAIYTTDANATAYSDLGGLAPANTYYYRVKAVNDDHESRHSDTVEATTHEYRPVTIIIPHLHGQPGEDIVMPVYVKNFEDVLTAQFTLLWDDAVLKYTTTSGEALEGMHFNSPQPGAMIFLWDNELAVPFTLPDNQALFNIHFKVTGGDGATSDISVATGLPFPKMEFGDEEGKEMPAEAENGSFKVISKVVYSGVVKNTKGTPLKEVTVHASGDDIDSETTTGADGRFSFSTLPGSIVEITPSKEDNKWNNGITTLDIAIIRRHLAWIKRIEDPYLLIAANVNDDDDISMRDVVEIRKVILAMETSFTEGHWKFVPEGFVFADPTSPFPFDQKITVSSMVNDENINFYGIKLGDVNGSWDASKARGKSGETLSLDMANLQVGEEDHIRIPIKAANFKALSGLQFTIAWDAEALELEAIEENPLNAYFGETHIDKGYLTVAWDEPAIEGATLADHETILDLGFKIKQRKPAEIRINSDLTQSVAYNAALEEVEIVANAARIEFANPAGEPKLELFQNYPNPAGQSGTKIKFSLPEAGSAKLIIYNAIGDIVERIEGSFAAGENETIWIPKSKMPEGIYFYSLEYSGRRLTKKMIVR